MKVRDGDWILHDHDPQTGRTVWHYFDGARHHFRTDYPVENILKDNEAARAEMAGARWGEGRRVASIPLNIFYDQLDEAQLQGDSKYLSRWLNDADHAAFRTFEGRV